MDSVDVEAVFDKAAATYDLTPFPFFTPFSEALIEFAGIRAGERVLDVGCGPGAGLAAAVRAGASAVGVELSPAMAERARAAAPRADGRGGDGGPLRVPGGSVAGVIPSFVVFFMADPTAALREWGRVLAPGGRLAIGTWASPDPRWAFEREVRTPYIGRMDPTVRAELGTGLAVLDRFNNPAKVDAELAA